MEYYRYDNIQTTNGTSVYLSTYLVLKETKKGIWIDNYGVKKFILKDSRKKFACQTKELAKESFIARKERQIRILLYQLENARGALREIDSIGVSEDTSLTNKLTMIK